MQRVEERDDEVGGDDDESVSTTSTLEDVEGCVEKMRFYTPLTSEEMTRVCETTCRECVLYARACPRAVVLIMMAWKKGCVA